MRVHTVPRGTMPPLPEQIKGDIDRVLPGGLPPVGYRARNAWGGASPRARSDGTTTRCRSECFHSVSEWDKTARNGLGAFVAP
jgi:hypothetical protein